MTFPMKRLSVSCNQVGHWLLLVGPNTIRPILANVIAGLAIEEPVRVLDCGRMLNGIEISMNLRDRPEALERVSFSASEIVSRGAEGPGRHTVHRRAVRGAEPAASVLQ